MKEQVYLKELYSEDIGGNIDIVINNLQKLKEEYNQYESLEIVIKRGYDYCDIELYGWMEEPEHKRLAREEKAKEQYQRTKLLKEQKELEQYLKLKEKFENLVPE